MNARTFTKRGIRRWDRAWRDKTQKRKSAVRSKIVPRGKQQSNQTWHGRRHDRIRISRTDAVRSCHRPPFCRLSPIIAPATEKSILYTKQKQKHPNRADGGAPFRYADYLLVKSPRIAYNNHLPARAGGALCILGRLILWTLGPTARRNRWACCCCCS